MITPYPKNMNEPAHSAMACIVSKIFPLKRCDEYDGNMNAIIHTRLSKYMDWGAVWAALDYTPPVLPQIADLECLPGGYTDGSCRWFISIDEAIIPIETRSWRFRNSNYDASGRFFIEYEAGVR